MADITFQTRIAAVLGLPNDATDEQLVTAVTALAHQAAAKNVNNEREMRIQGIMVHGNCGRDSAIHVLAQQDAEDRKTKAEEDAAASKKKK